jgi:hypothetical protein
MSDDASKAATFSQIPTFSMSEGNLTHLHGTEVPGGMITLGNGIVSAKASSPEQTDWAVNGAYDFAERLRKP